MATESARYLSTLHKQIDQYFNFNEVRTLCFQMGVDYENISGDIRSAFIRNLIVSLAKQNQLSELIVLLRQERPFVDWQNVPADFALPTTMVQESIQQVVNYHVYGDYVGGDKVGGDKITVGNIVGSQGVAIGAGAQASVHIQHGSSGDELASLFAPLLAEVGGNSTAVAQVSALKEEVGKGAQADDEKIADLIGDIVEIVPPAQNTLVHLFANSSLAQSLGGATKYVLKRLSK